MDLESLFTATYLVAILVAVTAVIAGAVLCVLRRLKKNPSFVAVFICCGIALSAMNTLASSGAMLPPALRAGLDRSEEAPTPQAIQLTLRDAAAQIAIAAVKRREGWAGKADPPTLKGTSFYVAVRRTPGATSDWRYSTIDGESGKIVAYAYAK
jgi:hypothetical protein